MRFKLKNTRVIESSICSEYNSVLVQKPYLNLCCPHVARCHNSSIIQAICVSHILTIIQQCGAVRQRRRCVLCQKINISRTTVAEKLSELQYLKTILHIKFLKTVNKTFINRYSLQACSRLKTSKCIPFEILHNIFLAVTVSYRNIAVVSLLLHPCHARLAHYPPVITLEGKML